MFQLLHKNSKGNILIENVVFIILNVLFFSLLVLFILKQGNGAIIMEENYAKQIALLVDSAQPNMILKLHMGDAKKIAEKNGVAFSEIVSIDGNLVRVKLSEKGGYSYSFFNKVEVGNPYTDGEYYIFTII